jgi:hypothetical protein
MMTSKLVRKFWNTSRKLWLDTPQGEKEYSTVAMNGKEVWIVTVVMIPMDKRNKRGEVMTDRETGEVLKTFVPTGVRFELMHGGFDARSAHKWNNVEYIVPGQTMFCMKRNNMVSTSPAWTFVNDRLSQTCKPNTLNKKADSKPLDACPAWIQAAVAAAWEKYETVMAEKRAAA